MTWLVDRDPGGRARADVTWWAGLSLYHGREKGTVADFQTFAEVDTIGFTCKYRPIADYPK